nr:hypothetical protein pmam_359 [Pithovirus mammoth]
MGKLQFGDEISSEVDKSNIILSPKSSRKNFCSNTQILYDVTKK